jgi:hypothetical protein
MRVAFLLLTVLGAGAPPLQGQGLPWKAGDAPPSLAGFSLQQSSADVRSRLGSAVRIDTLGQGADAVVTVTDRALGVTVTSSAAGITGIHLLRPEAGAIDQVRVGDSRQAILARWGRPTSTMGSTSHWVVGDWAVDVELGRGGRVARLGVSGKT